MNICLSYNVSAAYDAGVYDGPSEVMAGRGYTILRSDVDGSTIYFEVPSIPGDLDPWLSIVYPSWFDTGLDGVSCNVRFSDAKVRFSECEVFRGKLVAPCDVVFGTDVFGGDLVVSAECEGGQLTLGNDAIIQFAAQNDDGRCKVTLDMATGKMGVEQVG